MGKSLTALALLAAFLALPAIASSVVNLSCTGPYDENGQIHITYVDQSRVSTDAIFPLHTEDSFVNRTFDGDCEYHSKRFMCYEDGQFMVNIPKSLRPVIGNVAKVWINLDTDDITDHQSLGDPYICTVVK